MGGQPAWVISAISTASSLLGTIVGGMVTYWSSKKSFERQQASEQSAQRHTELRDAAMRFIAAINDTPIIQSGLDRIRTQWGDVTTQLAAAQADRDFVDLARTIDPDIPPDATREEAVLALMRSTAAFDDDIRRAVTLLTELRLIAPPDVADSAQRVLYAAATRELAAAITPQRQRPVTEAFNREVNDFFNRVRHHMNVEDIDFDFFNEDTMRRVLRA